MIEQRKARRFDLRLPFELVRSRSTRIHRVSETRNISSIGVLFGSEGGLDVGDPIEYLITLPTGREGKTVRIRCLGKVVRVGPAEAAATLERYEFLRQGTAEGGEAIGSAAGGGRGTSRRKAAGS